MDDDESERAPERLHAPEPRGRRPTAKDDREARLAAALRANLRRRKAANPARPDDS